MRVKTISVLLLLATSLQAASVELVPIDDPEGEVFVWEVHQVLWEQLGDESRRQVWSIWESVLGTHGMFPHPEDGTWRLRDPSGDSTLIVENLHFDFSEAESLSEGSVMWNQPGWSIGESLSQIESLRIIRSENFPGDSFDQTYVVVPEPWPLTGPLLAGLLLSLASWKRA